MKLKTTAPFMMKYKEFPELLFGTTETGSIYFDATFCITKKGDPKKHSAIDFARKFSHWFITMKDIYDISDLEVMATDEATGHILIDESLALLFISYIDPAFGVYMIDRVSEMLLNGVTLSDTCIIEVVKNRFSKDELIKIIDQ